MIEKSLYDKVISVTLYKRKDTKIRSIKVYKTRGYGETHVKGKKVLFSNGKEDIDKATGFAVTSMIEFYEGSSYYTYSNPKKGKDRYVKHVATGPLYKYNTMDDMKKGVHPDGSLMQTGDRAYVIENRSRWTAVVTGSEEALLDSQVTSEGYRETLSIECPISGLKPDMSFSVNLLPGQNCYKAVLKIRNLNIHNADIRLWDKMEIVAGYREGSKARFVCPIFSSYIESPNPDGITVFEGITVGQVDTMMYDSLLEIHFNQEKMTLISMISQVARGIMDGINVHSTLPDDLNQLEITISKQVVYAENGFAVLNWLQTTVSSIIEEHTYGQASVLVQLINSDLNIMVLNGPNRPASLDENVISLRMVSGATFNGTALTVEAPWDPALKPGDLFYMPPQFIQGSHLPNVLEPAAYVNEDNLYRALTMSISFGTTDGNNKMSILAVPAQYAGQISLNRTTEMLPEDYAALKTAELEYLKNGAKAIPVGEISNVEKTAMKVVEKKTGVSMFDAHKTLPGFASFESLTIDSEITGSCLSVIGQYYCYKWDRGPKLNEDKGTSKPAGRYHIPIPQLKDISALAAAHPQSNGIPCHTLWWPLIAIATYWKWQEDELSGKSHNWMHINLDNPDYLVNGKSLYIPVFTDYSALRSIKNVYKDAYNDYKEKYPSYSIQWRAMYYLLGGTDDLG